VFREIYAAFDRAEKDHAVVIITGREDVFSAGFDLKVMKRGGVETLRMLRMGFALTARALNYPYPVVAACNGHVLAMGVFLMLSADHVIGTRGDYRIAANEVAIGMILPRVAAAMLEHRLDPAAYQRGATLSHDFTTEAALDAGFFDELVDPGELQARSGQRAREFSKLDMRAHRITKRRIRRSLVRRIRWSIPLDLLGAMRSGMRRARSS
jgi:enoyl-CoA hydratase